MSIHRVSEIAADQRVHRAFQWLHLNEMRIMQWQRAVTEIPAPPFGEQLRAQWMRDRFIELDLCNVFIDAEGNVLGTYPANADVEPAADCIVVDAHMDTIFPLDTPLDFSFDGDRSLAPGISDNGCGVAAMLGIIAAMRDGHVKVSRQLLFAATVGEEGEGNLRGIRALFRDLNERRPRAAIVLDGAGTAHAVTKALGSRRYRITVRGPGGHSWTNASTPSAIVTLARGLAAIADIAMPASPRTTLNIGTIQGGSSINAIAEEATAAVDTRSTGSEQLTRLEVLVHRAMEDAVTLTNNHAREAGAEGRVSHSIEVIGDRPAGMLNTDAELFKDLLAVDRHLSIATDKKVASTNANIPLSLGIEAVGLGAGGTAGGVHTRNEWFNPQGRELALRRILLLTLVTANR